VRLRVAEQTRHRARRFVARRHRGILRWRSHHAGTRGWRPPGTRPPKRRTPVFLGGPLIARPGLEPGTPRFSVVRSRPSRVVKSLESERFLRRRRLGWKFANCGLLRAIKEMAAAHLLVRGGVALPPTTDTPSRTAQRRRRLRRAPEFVMRANPQPTSSHETCKLVGVSLASAVFLDAAGGGRRGRYDGAAPAAGVGRARRRRPLMSRSVDRARRKRGPGRRA
jgi:hypothetical protein